MKLSHDKRWYYAGAAVLLIIIAFIIWGQLHKTKADIAGTTTEATTEPPATTEVVQNELEYDYYYERPKLQRRVIAIRELEDAELPAPFDFTQYGEESYKDKHFYALVILDIDTDVRLNTEVITEVTQLEILGTLQAVGIEQTYKQLEIRYEDEHAVYKHDKQYFVTSLTEPKLYKKYAIYDELSLIPFSRGTNLDTMHVDVYQTPYRKVSFSISEKQFISMPDNNMQPETDAFTFEGKTIEHKPSLTSVQGPSFSSITEEPRLNQFTLGSSSSVVFERLGKPETVKWLLGNYLKYDDLMIYSTMDEKGDNLTFFPCNAVLYFGDYPVSEIQKGMTFKEVEQIIGPQPALYFSENNEMTYPLSMSITKNGFNIGIGFDSELKVSQFFIRSAETAEEKANQGDPYYEPMPNEVVSAFSEERFKVVGLQGFSDFAIGFNSCYFNASAVTNGSSGSIDIGFYTYDSSQNAPTLISDQPMRMVFELLHDANPSVITIGKEDGVLYKIDLNTFDCNPLSGSNYKHYVVRDGAVIKASMFNDTTFLGHYGLKTNETIGQFEVNVPEVWNVRYGDYPEGLYWSLANVFSKDIGLDLRDLKGSTVDVTVYRLESRLSASDPNTAFEHPTNAVVLRADGQVKGAWLTYNTSAVGPSLEWDSLEDLTGKTFEDWVWDEGIFVMTTSYLPSPEATINNFFEAIQTGNKQKASACLTPGSFLNSLTTNHDFSKSLYQTNFNENNSMVENIVSATDVEIVSYYHNTTFKPVENNQAYFDAMPIGTRINAEISLNLEWKLSAFNSEGKDTRFVTLEKTPYGWKMDGLATGR